MARSAVRWHLSNDGRFTFAKGRTPFDHGAGSSARGRLTRLFGTPTYASNPEPPVDPTLITYGRTGASTPALPAGAIYVDPVAGVNTNSGALGSPVKTFERATQLVAAGGTIALYDGAKYHEGRVKANANGVVGISVNPANVTVQAVPGCNPIFDGSTVLTAASFTAGTVGTTSVWTRSWAHFRRDPTYNWNTDAAYATAVSSGNWEALDEKDPKGRADQDIYWHFVDYNYYPCGARPERMWINGVQLTQVENASLVGPGKFAINAATNTLYIGDNPSGKTVEITDLQILMNFLGTGARLLGVTVQRYAASQPMGAVVKFHRPSPTVKECSFIDTAMTAVAFIGDPSNISPHDYVMEHNTIIRAGGLGVGINQTDRGSTRFNLFQSCNDKRLQVAPASGALKYTYCQYQVIDQNKFVGTKSKDVWLDCDMLGTQVTRNWFEGGYQRCIVTELSDDTTIAGNFFIRSGTDTIAIVDSGNCRVYNNTIFDAGAERNTADPMTITGTFDNPRSINVQRTERYPRGNGAISYGIDKRYNFPATAPPAWPYNPGWTGSPSRPNEARNNVICWGNTQAYLAEEPLGGALEDYVTRGTKADYNVYQKDPAAVQAYPWTARKTTGQDNAQNIASARTKFGWELNGVEVTGQTSPIIDPTTGQLTAAYASNHNLAYPLPADIAAMIGQSTGAKHMGNFPLSSVPAWQQAMLAATTADPFHIAFAGNSIEYGALSDGSSNPKYLNSFPGRVKTGLDADYGNPGVPYVMMNVNTNGIRANPAHDPRWSWVGTVTDLVGTTIGKGWHRRGAVQIATGATNYVTFTETCTHFVTHVISGSAGDQYVSIDGGAAIKLRNVVGSGSVPTIERQSGTHAKHIRTLIPAGALGSHTIRIWGVGGDVTLHGVGWLRSGGGRFQVSNPSMSSMALSTLIPNDETNGGYGPVMIDSLDADLLVICLGGNDIQGGATVATLKSSWNTLIARQKATGGFAALYTPPIASTTLTPTTTWEQMRVAAAETAAAADIPFFDQAYLLGATWEAANAAGYYSGSPIHPNDAGAAKMALAFRAALPI